MDGIEYLHRNDEVVAALLGLMRLPDELLPFIAAEARKLIAASSRTEQQKHLLLSLLETYLQLKTPQQEREFERLLNSASVRPPPQ